MAGKPVAKAVCRLLLLGALPLCDGSDFRISSCAFVCVGCGVIDVRGQLSFQRSQPFPVDTDMTLLWFTMTPTSQVGAKRNPGQSPRAVHLLRGRRAAFGSVGSSAQSMNTQCRGYRSRDKMVQGPTPPPLQARPAGPPVSRIP